MKNTFLFFLIIIFIYGPLHSQEWLPIGTRWSYKSTVFGYPIENNEYLITGDTIFEGKQCRVLEKAQWSCDLKPQIEYFYKEKGKLYYYANGFKLLYDFSAEVGETYSIPIWQGFGSMEDRYIRVDSIQYITVEGLTLKKFYVSDGYLDTDGNISYYKSGIPNNDIIIEDVGRLGTFSHYLETGICDASYTFPLDSFYHPEYGYLDFENVIVNSQEEELVDISFYPNPTRDIVYITNSKALHSIVITNQRGQMLSEKNCRNAGQEIAVDIAHLDPGVYYIQAIGAKAKLLEVYKIVVI